MLHIRSIKAPGNADLQVSGNHPSKFTADPQRHFVFITNDFERQFKFVVNSCDCFLSSGRIAKTGRNTRAGIRPFVAQNLETNDFHE